MTIEFFKEAKGAMRCKRLINGSLKDPARLEWHEVTKVAHYYLQMREDEAPYGEDG